MKTSRIADEAIHNYSLPRPSHADEPDTRTVPVHPELVALLREHLAEFGTAPDGHLFTGIRGGELTTITTGEHGSPHARPRSSPPSQCHLAKVDHDAKESGLRLTSLMVAGPSWRVPWSLGFSPGGVGACNRCWLHAVVVVSRRR